MTALRKPSTDDDRTICELQTTMTILKVITKTNKKDGQSDNDNGEEDDNHIIVFMMKKSKNNFKQREAT